MSALLIPVVLAVAYALAMLKFSVWQTQKSLAARSRPLRDPEVMALANRLARALDLPAIKVNVFDVDVVNGLAAPDGQIYLTRAFLERKARGLVTACLLYTSRCV